MVAWSTSPVTRTSEGCWSGPAPTRVKVVEADRLYPRSMTKLAESLWPCLGYTPSRTGVLSTTVKASGRLAQRRAASHTVTAYTPGARLAGTAADSSTLLARVTAGEAASPTRTVI